MCSWFREIISLDNKHVLHCLENYAVPDDIWFAMSQPLKNKCYTKSLTSYQDIYHKFLIVFVIIIINQNRQKGKIMLWDGHGFLDQERSVFRYQSFHLTSFFLCSSVRRVGNTYSACWGMFIRMMYILCLAQFLVFRDVHLISLYCYQQLQLWAERKVLKKQEEIYFNIYNHDRPFIP